MSVSELATCDASLSQRRRAVADYIHEFDQVEGWLSGATARGMAELIWEQEQIGVKGNVAEIGVHHGKSFLVLAGAMRPDEVALAVDVFERQELNVDGSSCGDRALFEAHLRRYFPAARVSVIAASSMELRGKEDAYGLAALRLLSIDGGHTRPTTLNDLCIAESSLSPNGVCCLDDIFNPHWPGVISGLFDFLTAGADLVPFLYLPNKLLLCRRECREAWGARSRRLFHDALARRDLEPFGFPFDIVGETATSDRAPAALAEPPEPDLDASQLRAELAAIKRSRSWCRTAPARALRAALPARRFARTQPAVPPDGRQ